MTRKDRIKKFIPFFMMGMAIVFVIAIFMYILYNIFAIYIFNVNPVFNFWSIDTLRIYITLGVILSVIIAHYLWDEVI